MSLASGSMSVGKKGIRGCSAGGAEQRRWPANFQPRGEMAWYCWFHGAKRDGTWYETRPCMQQNLPWNIWIKSWPSWYKQKHLGSIDWTILHALMFARRKDLDCKEPRRDFWKVSQHQDVFHCICLSPYKTHFLAGGLEHFWFFHILGMSSSQLTNSYFSEG